MNCASQKGIQGSQLSTVLMCVCACVCDRERKRVHLPNETVDEEQSSPQLAVLSWEMF